MFRASLKREKKVDHIILDLNSPSIVLLNNQEQATGNQQIQRRPYFSPLVGETCNSLGMTACVAGQPDFFLQGVINES